jgi:hypothetical protein
LGFLREKFAEAGIVHKVTPRYTAEQNGRAERLNRTLMKKMRCLLFQAKVPGEFWGEAMLTANHLRNLVPTKAGKKTPYELFTGKVPDVSNLRVFGCCAFVQVPAKLRGKLDKRSVKGILVGYENSRKAWRVLCPSDNGRWELHVSRDVYFVEHVRATEALKEYVCADDTLDIGFWTMDDEEKQQQHLGGEMAVPDQVEVNASVQDDAANESSAEGDVQIDPAVAEQEVNEEQEDSVGESR